MKSDATVVDPHQDYSSILECDIGKDLREIYQSVVSSYESQKSYLKPLQNTFGTLYPIGNVNQEASFCLFSARDLSSPDIQGSSLTLTFQREPTGFGLSDIQEHKSLVLRKPFSLLQKWLAKPSQIHTVPKRLIVMNGKSIQSIRKCEPCLDFDMYQVGMMKSKKIKPKSKPEYHTFDFRVHCSRSDSKCYLFGSKFNHKGDLTVNGLRSGQEDGLAKHSGVLLWRPLSYDDNGVPTHGRWTEISAFGRPFELRTNPKSCGRSIYDPPLSSLPANQLLDYSVIYNQGICFLWRAPTKLSPPRPLQVPVDISQDEICCPVTLDVIPTDSLTRSVKRSSTAVSRKSFFGKSDLGEHVFSYFQHWSGDQLDIRKCCICRRSGHLTPLISPDSPHLSQGERLFAFDTCGHMIDSKEEHFWSTVLTVPLTAMRDKPTLSKTPIVGPEYQGFYHCCFYCGSKVNVARKLYFTTL
ncbi:hypothetical protein EDD86DRAFT_278707 [Gorgonomyces haynaldii]|nr:hypothetical protein EDD86DRAFT_278707 [Gorgonomyces haynaldii]